MDKKRIAIVTPGSFAVPSQVNSSVERVATQVCELLKEEFQFTIFSKKIRAYPVFEKRNGITHIRPFRGKGSSYMSSVRAWLNKLKPDLIQVENRPNMVPYIRKTNRRIPIWLSLHSTRFISKPYITQKQLRRCLQAADQIVVNSRFLQEYVVSKAPSIRDKTVMNYPGVDTERFFSRWSPQGEESRQAHVNEMGYAGKKMIVYAGRLQEMKGVHHLLAAMANIIQEHPNVVLIIVGSAYYDKHTITPYVKTLHRMGNQWPHHVRFIPHVPHDEMARWFRIADVAVVPSAEQEAFGLVNVEAMSSGVPVVATRAGGMKEIIKHHHTGILIDTDSLQAELSQAIIRLLKDQELAKQMGQHGSQYAREHFTWNHTAQRFRAMVKGG